MGEATQARTSTVGDLLMRALAATGLGGSVLLLVDYLRPAPMFCGEGQGCDVVRLSSYSHLLGVPVPVLGVLYFAVVLGLTLMQRPRSRDLLALAGGLGALGAIAFTAIQAFVLHAFCVYCMVVDVSAIVLGVLAVALRRTRASPLGGRGWAASGLIGMVAFGAPFGYGFVHRPPEREPIVGVPQSILAEQRPGVATIVEFMDFECPFCRAQHARLAVLVEEYGSKVRIVRKHVPLSMHDFADPAARLAICAELQGRGDEMADLLFKAEDLRPAALAAAAQRAGIPPETLPGCTGSVEVEKRMRLDRHAAAEAQVGGLPTFYIGTERFEGLQNDDTVRAAIRRALQSDASDGGAP